MSKLNDQQQFRRDKLKNLVKNGFNFPSSTFEHDNLVEINEKFSQKSKEFFLENQVKIAFAGRLIRQRGPFFIIFSQNLQFQAYISKEFQKKNEFIFANLDLGDIIEVSGYLFKTQTGQLSIKVNNFSLLTKSLHPLPDQYYGIENPDEKYRKRYLDLLVNSESAKTFRLRSKIISLIRTFFDSQGFLEVDTPVLHPVLGGASAKPFITYYNSLSQNFYLRIATELPLKKLLVAGFDRVYEIGKIFRNEGFDSTHNPEFTSIEFYQAYANLEKIMDQTENLFRFLFEKLNLDPANFDFSNKKINFLEKFARYDMIEITSKLMNFDLKSANFADLVEKAKEEGLKIEPFFKKGHLINKFFEKFVEPTLINPTFIIGHPIEISPLAKSNPNNPNFTLRAELFICGKEFANMFDELNDPIDQLSRFQAQIIEKNQGNQEASEIDNEFVQALEYGMPPAGGCGIGIDRLTMLLTKNESIREVILFPQLKPKKD
ncbi:lysine--tRNA ligase [Mesomycoplasma hyopneumoniae]|uniref:lysine--tRNA ligase n=1 Tax=Mesomycoplasma hyopneumoniae TaxID=2099 RepID=UPI0011B3B722|nr:lysine--tRNA ligase [Mesomycoplasma hyopneumoniae]MXR34461.1 lysine--tRNA ligase [Mesomycoplasma hyopneumoniae]NYN92252.1 lysine--tRNA ligase [Mesomycoplasma hyopneumoniae]QEA02432.1 lysine--tRNA ligase [Mesomycoplasma hyopneumoniae]